MDGNADAAVVDGAGPTGGAGDVGKSLLGIEDDADGFGRSEIELGFEVAEIVFEDAQNSASEIGSGAAVIFQVEVGGLAFAVTFFFGFVAFGFLQGVLDIRIVAQFFGTFPFGDGLIHFVGAVIGPAHELGHVGGIGRDALGVFERVERGGELALAQI